MFYWQGCDIPDIAIVVQWKLTTTVSSFVQRAGRSARGIGRQGLAVLLVEPSAFQVDLGAGEKSAKEKKQSSKKAKKKGSVAVKKSAKEKKTFAEARGLKRGSHAGGNDDAILVRVQPPLDPAANDEGLTVLVQTGLCRRAVLTSIFANKIAGQHLSIEFYWWFTYASIRADRTLL